MKNNNVYIISFWLLILCSVISVFKIIGYYGGILTINGFPSPKEPISINLTLKERKPQIILACFNDYCTNLENDAFYNTYSIKYNNENEEFNKQKIKNIYIAYPKENNIQKEIEDIYLYVGTKGYHYGDSDIKNFDKKEFKIQLNDTEKEQNYNAIKLPEINNGKGIFTSIQNNILSFFYNWKIFLVTYIGLIFAGAIYVFNKNIFNFKINKNTHYLILLVIILLAIFLRAVNITYYPLWIDEIYTKGAVGHFSGCFSDSGNPPLFYIFEYLSAGIIPFEPLNLRIMPFVFGVLFVPSVYLLFKNINKNLALFGAFFASINIINIYYSQEARGYSLCILLCVIGVYLLFRYLNNPTLKNLILYTIFAICSVNTYYYLILFVFTNAIWGCTSLFEENKIREIKKFVSANIISLITLIPYLIISFKTALNSSFNSWIPALSKNTFLYTINEYFINKYVFVFLCSILLINLIFCFLPENMLKKINLKINPKKEDLFIYLIYSISLILICACLISVFVKPVVHKRMIMGIYGLIFILEVVSVSSVVEYIKESKAFSAIKYFYSIILILVCFSMTKPMPLREIFSLNDYMNFVKVDSQKYSNEYKLHAMTYYSKEFFDSYKDILELPNINWHFIDPNTDNIINTIKKSDFEKSGKKTVIYFNSIGVDTNSVTFLNPKAYICKSNFSTSGKLIFK